METIKANEYQTREQLENYIRQVSGGSTIPKTDFEIVGTQEELEKLQLSASSCVFGVKVKVI